MAVDPRLLESSSLFAAASPSQRAALATLLDNQLFPDGTLICKEGAHGDTIFFVDRGEVVFFTHDAQGCEKEFRTLGPGAFFGEVAAFGDGRRSANARAIGEVCAYGLHRDRVCEFLQVYPEMAEMMLREMARRLGTSGGLFRHMVTPGVSGVLENDRSGLERWIQGVVRQIGSVYFLVLNIVISVIWVAANTLIPRAWDPPPFSYLGLTVTIEALLVAVLVLAKQNRDGKDDNIRAGLILSNTQSTEREMQHLRDRIDELSSRPSGVE